MSKVNGMEVTVNAETGEFSIVGKIPDNPPLSSTEKNILLATTKGNKPIGEEYNGQEIYLSVNMYCDKAALATKAKAEKPKTPAKKK